VGNTQYNFTTDLGAETVVQNVVRLINGWLPSKM